MMDGFLDMRISQANGLSVSHAAAAVRDLRCAEICGPGAPALLICIFQKVLIKIAHDFQALLTDSDRRNRLTAAQDGQLRFSEFCFSTELAKRFHFCGIIPSQGPPHFFPARLRVIFNLEYLQALIQ